MALEYAAAIEDLLQHPESFQSLDFTALPSPSTHPDETVRALATEYFLKMCELPGNTTLHVQPITPDMTPEQVEAVRQFNQGRYDR